MKLRAWLRICPVLLGPGFAQVDSLVVNPLARPADPTTIARDTATPPAVLNSLGEQGVQAILFNPNTPAEALASLFRHRAIAEDTSAWFHFVRHRNTPADILLKIAETALQQRYDNGVLPALAAHERLPEERRRAFAILHLDRMLASAERYPDNAFSNPLLPLERIRELAGYPVPSVRRRVLENPSLPLPELQQLANDHVDAVAASARVTWRARDPAAAESMQRLSLRPLSPGAADVLIIDTPDAADFVAMLRANDVLGARAAWSRISEGWRDEVAKQLAPPPHVDVPESLLRFAPEMGARASILLTRVLQRPTADRALLERFARSDLLRHVNLAAVYSAALQQRRDAFVQELLDRNLPVTGVDEFRLTPLMRAVTCNGAKWVKPFLERGADPMVRSDGLTAADLAALKLEPEALRILAAGPAHRDLLRDFDAWAQPAPADSPFVGSWATGFAIMVSAGSNGGMSQLTIRADGSFLFENGHHRLRGGWRLTDNERATGKPSFVTLFGDRQATDRERAELAELGFSLSPDRRTLLVALGRSTLTMTK